MYEYIKIGGAFVIGVGAGILASKTYFQTKYEKIANEEIESVRDSVSHRSGHIIEETSLEEPEKFAKDLEELVDSTGRVKLYSSLETVNAGKQEAIEEEEEVKDIVDKILETEHPEDDRPEDCYEVSELDYSETALGYEKLVLHYYIEDDMLVNADDGDWTNHDLGLEALERIRHAEESELYFRNDPSAKDYEVIRIKGTYYIDMK